jgi:microcystin-dependent protein
LNNSELCYKDSDNFSFKKKLSKKKIFSTVLALMLATSIFSQGNSGLGFNYQAVVRGADGFVLPKQSVELRFSLLPGQQATQASYVETHSVTTDAYGTVGVTIGKGAKVDGIAATFADVNFAAVHYWLKVEIKEGSTYRELSYSALSSVPYAEVANNASTMPAGTVVSFMGNEANIPQGWLLCDGRAISRANYPALYAAIGTVWGFGDNATTFNLPDLQGVFERGVSGTSGKDADAANRTPIKEGGNSGNNVGSYQSDEFKSHTHNIRSRYRAEYGGGGFDEAFQPYNETNSSNANRPNAITPTGGNETRPKNVYVYKIIKY